MSPVYSIVLAHPKTILPDSEVRHTWFVCEPWAEPIMEIHMTSSDMASRIDFPEDWDDTTPCYMSLIDGEDLSDMCVDGFQMVDFWIDRKLEGLTAGWGRWYAYVSRSTTAGWTVTLLLDNQGNSEEAVQDISCTIWRMYKEYFDSKISHYTSSGETLYKDHDYETLRDRLMFISTERDHGDLGRLVDDRLSAMPRMGDVYHTDRHGGDCLLWCTTNDNCEKRKTSTSKLWYP